MESREPVIAQSTSCREEMATILTMEMEVTPNQGQMEAGQMGLKRGCMAPEGSRERMTARSM